MKKLIYSLCILVLFTINISAETKNEKDVEGFIKNMSTQSQNILNNKSLNEKQKEKKYEDFSGGIIDTEWVARFILGKTWKTLTKEQQDKFINLYTKYILQNYMPKLQNYNKDIVAKKIVRQKEGVYMASCQTYDEKGRLINVDFRIIERNNTLYITDIIPEGISFIGNQRTDVGSSISTLGFDGFMAELEKKVK